MEDARHKIHKYNYRYTGASIAYGPIYAHNKDEAKRKIRHDIRITLKKPNARLPNGFEIWRTK